MSDGRRDFLGHGKDWAAPIVGDKVGATADPPPEPRWPGSLWKDPVPVTGVWLRTQGGRVQVLLEFDRRWHMVNDEPLHDGERTIIGHITEPAGIRKAPIDPLAEG